MLLLSLLWLGVMQATASALPEQQEQRHGRREHRQNEREECESTPEICATMAAFGGSLVVPQVIPVFRVRAIRSPPVRLQSLMSFCPINCMSQPTAVRATSTNFVNPLHSTLSCLCSPSELCICTMMTIKSTLVGPNNCLQQESLSSLTWDVSIALSYRRSGDSLLHN